VHSRNTPTTRSVPVRATPRRAKTRPSRRRKPGLAWFERIARALLGLRRRIVVDGVRYKELGTTPLERAISTKGKGRKRYEVRFPAGRTMQINATAERRFADLMDVPELRSIRHAESMVRPGSRVLILGMGTGGLARQISRWIGPHGGLVAIEHDNESVRFARRRYRLESTSIERGGIELLLGELDGSFEIVIVTEAWLRRTERPGDACNEAWRVTGPGGRLVLVGDRVGDLMDKSGAGGAGITRLAPPDGGPPLLVLTRPESAHSPDRV
ncbi:MAG: methyltransferase domain-containing protein, partial [Phycisphaerales bacterium]|nr:methyltransferase domain-containing protein [Phycisphaerales bacterium]